MKVKQLKKLSKSKLLEKLEKERKAVSEIGFGVRTGAEKDYSQLKNKRKLIARILTMQNSGAEIKEEKATKTETKKATKKTKKKSSDTQEKKKKVSTKKEKKTKKVSKKNNL